jgi:hypothetical protein
MRFSQGYKPSGGHGIGCEQHLAEIPSRELSRPVTSRGIDGVSSWGTAERFEFVRNWAWKADRLSWDAMALFGSAPKRPLDYSGSAGLVGAITVGGSSSYIEIGQSSTSP